MRTVAGECGDESSAETCFVGARTRVVHVLVARSACSGRALSESARPVTSLIGTVMLYDERGRVCVACVACWAAVLMVRALAIVFSQRLMSLLAGEMYDKFAGVATEYE